LGSPFVLPTKIEAEDFDTGGEGVAYHDIDVGNNGGQYRATEGVDIEICTDTGGGYNVGWVSPNEWLEYTVSVPTAGEYSIDVRVASLSAGGSFHLEFNGTDQTGEITVPVTGGWQTWWTVSATATLAAGTQIMRFVPTSDGFNINYIEVVSGPTAITSGEQLWNSVLHPCYPNPFNPMTTISYNLREQVSVTLTIYDVTGREVKRLVDGEVTNSGRYEKIWDGRDETGRAVASGVYFYRLEAGGFTQTRKMTLIK
jgi:hypothetical protein